MFDPVSGLSIGQPIIPALHGTNAAFPRPGFAGSVLWVGTVDPTNALARDFVGTAATTSSFVGALDSMATPYRAHSVRRLRSAYTGPLLRVRRSSDNTEQDIGYTSAGDLDTTALATFVGSGSGFVTTWYDQSGNARHIAQTTQAAQPTLVASGTNTALGTKVAAAFDGTDDYMFDSAPGLYAAGTDTIAFVMSGTTATNGTLFSESTSTSANGFVRMVRASAQLWNVQATGSNGTSNYASSAASSNLFDGAAHQGFYTDVSATINTWKDGTAIHAALSAPRTNALSPDRFAMGASVGSSVANFAPAKVAEFIGWTSDQTASRTAFSTNQKSYFGTP